MALQRLPASGQNELQGGVVSERRVIPDAIRKRGVMIHTPFFVSLRWCAGRGEHSRQLSAQTAVAGMRRRTRGEHRVWNAMDSPEKNKEQSERNRVARGMIYGICIGVLLGMGLDNIPLGLCLGVAFGSTLGASRFRKNGNGTPQP